MAGAADKKQAVSNVKILKEIHLLTFSIQAISIVLVWYFHRPQSRWQSLVFSSPSWLCQYVLETTGRPKFATKDGRETLVSAGQDLKQSGLVEYMFDIIYMTLICHILMWVFGSNKVWLLYLAVRASFLMIPVNLFINSFRSPGTLVTKRGL
ncbi:unnamed protein product [Kuraishia capsulata CBS 1993]|uniref:Uncharacterized protein n=1 Tax=Kuraishia capsulata CBS 1993 TaxID=1382522 RepID=W6MI44_9ASCO|nr:uncharacterized protein KUCA_T00002040001 [Kuraishia capsulata CBS 1993]CDK26069.1 unnamed protein product [Kuraishia capsulata CBS 1993]